MLHGKRNFFSLLHSAVLVLLWGYCLSAWRAIKQIALCSPDLLTMMIRQAVSTIIGHTLCLQWLLSSLSASRLWPSFVTYKGEYRLKNEPELLLAVLATIAQAQAPIHIRYDSRAAGLNCSKTLYIIHSLVATTSHKRPPPVSDQFVNNDFVSQSKYCCSKSSLVSDHYSNFLSDRDQFLGQKFDIFFCFLFLVSGHWNMITHDH